MTEEHKGLPVHGYQPQSDAKVALVNGFKQEEERLLRKLDELRDGPKVVAVDDTPPIAPGEWRDVQVFEPITDPRWLAIARTGFETAFMALNRAVFQPQRIRLPEDDGNPPGKQTSPEIAALAGRYLALTDEKLEFLFMQEPLGGARREVMADLRKLAASALGQVQE